METNDEKKDGASLKNDNNDDRVRLDNIQKNESKTLSNYQKNATRTLDDYQKNESAAMRNEQKSELATLSNNQNNERVTLSNDQKIERVTLENEERMERNNERNSSDIFYSLAILTAVALLGMGGVVLWNVQLPFTGYATKMIADTTSPTVSYTEPENGMVSVPLNQVIFAAFSEAMSEQTIIGAFTVTGPNGTQVEGTVKNVGRTGIFTPTAKLAPNTRYTARISSVADDLTGNPMGTDYVWTFTTGGTPDSNAPLFKSYSHIDVEVEDHQNIGVFSLGGLYGDSWEKLTYGYPNPWAGTYLTVNVDGQFYTTSEDSKDGILMDVYNTLKPRVGGSSIVGEWILPSGIRVIEEWSVIQNTTVVNRIKIVNNDEVEHTLGARLLLDTKVGLNDGAPILVPGRSLMTTENEFTQNQLGSGYWKAYNQVESPTIVATGFIGGKGGMTFPDRLVVADWQKSKDTAWGYSIDGQRSILSDSSVILYYNPTTVQPGQERVIMTGYGVGEST